MHKKPVKILLSCLLAVSFLGFTGVNAIAAAIYYADAAAGNDANPGTSWGAAKATIQAAIDLATATGDRVYVAEGTYNERITFPDHNDFQLLGGYPSGGGTQDPWTNSTIIDGTGLTGSVVYIPGNFGASVGYTGLALDGFTIQNGTKTTFYGTGIESWSVDLAISRCVVQDNTNTGGYVGGIYIAALASESSLRTLRIQQSIIRNNSGPGAGGIFIDAIGYPSVLLTNNLVYGNTATATGTPWSYSTGGIAIGGGAQQIYTTQIMNCTIADNTSAHATVPAGGMSINLDSNDVNVMNSIIWNAQDDIYEYPGGAGANVYYSDIGDADYTDTGVIHTNPAFAGIDDYHLTAGSGGCIDGASATGAPSVDLEGTSRPQGSGYDMGAYEYSVPLVQYTLTTSVVGGHGTISPPSGDYDENQVVGLLATPDSGYRVKAWTGTDDDSSTSTQNQVTMDSDKTVTVQFESIPALSLAEDWSAVYGDVDGADGSDSCTDAAFDNNGEVIAAGAIFIGDGDSTTGTDAYGVRYDSSGLPVNTGWPVIYDLNLSYDRDYFTEIAVDSSNNVIFSGWRTVGTNPEYEYTVWKYGEDGTQVWVNGHAQDAWNAANDVCVDSNDNIFSAGYVFTGWTGLYWDWRIQKWASDSVDGTPLESFNVNLGGSDFQQREYAHGIACDSNDDIIVVGRYSTSGTTADTSDQDWHIRKYPNSLDNDGGTPGYQPIWTYSFKPSSLGNGGEFADAANSVAVDSADNVYVVGYQNEGTGNDAGKNDYRGTVLKLNKNDDGAGNGVLAAGPVYFAAGHKSSAATVAVDENNVVYVGGYRFDGTNNIWYLEAFDSGLNLIGMMEWPELHGSIAGINIQGSKLVLGGTVDNRADGAPDADNDWKVLVLDTEKKFPWIMFLPTIIQGNQ